MYPLRVFTVVLDTTRQIHEVEAHIARVQDGMLEFLVYERGLHWQTNVFAAGSWLSYSADMPTTAQLDEMERAMQEQLGKALAQQQAAQVESQARHAWMYIPNGKGEPSKGN
jgi:hypothetical protein